MVACEAHPKHIRHSGTRDFARTRNPDTCDDAGFRVRSLRSRPGVTILLLDPRRSNHFRVGRRIAHDEIVHLLGALEPIIRTDDRSLLAS
jgi:hypothetical protein